MRLLILKGYESAKGYSDVKPNGFRANGTKAISGLVNYHTIDGSYLRVTVEANGSDVNYTLLPWNIYYPDGSYVRVNGNTVTLNNNVASVTQSGNSQQVAITNSSGKSLIINKNVTNANINTAVWVRDEVTVPSVNGGTLKYVIDWKKNTLPAGRLYNNGAGNSQLTPVHWGVAYIQLPLPGAAVAALGTEPASWSSYKFGYNDTYGELNYIRMPGGAEYNYEYILDGTGVSGNTKQAVA